MSLSKTLAALAALTIAVATGFHLWPFLERLYWVQRAALVGEHNPDLAVVPGESVGEVHLDMKRSEVVTLIGSPQITNDSQAAEYLTLGLAIIYDRDDSVVAILGGGFTLDSSITKAFKGRTASGITMGSSSHEVEAVFGEPDSVESEAVHEMWLYRRFGIVFSFDNGNLGHLALSKPQPDETGT